MSRFLAALLCAAFWLPSSQAAPYRPDPVLVASDLGGLVRALNSTVAQGKIEKYVPQDKTSLWLLSGALLKPAENLPRIREILREAPETERALRDLDSFRGLLSEDQARQLALNLAWKLGRPEHESAGAAGPYQELLASIAGLYDGSEPSVFAEEPGKRTRVMVTHVFSNDGRRWRLKEGRKDDANARLVLASLHAVSRGGADVSAPRVILTKAMPGKDWSAHSTSGDLILSGNSIESIAKEPRPKEALVQALLIDDLSQGVPGPMAVNKFDIIGTLLAGNPSIEESIAAYRQLYRRRLGNLRVWFESVRGIPLEERVPLNALPAASSRQYLRDASDNSWYVLERDGSLGRVSLREDKSFAWLRLSGRSRMEAIALDDRARLLFAAADGRAISFSLDGHGAVDKPISFQESKAHLRRIFFDPQENLLLGLTSTSTGLRPAVVAWKVHEGRIEESPVVNPLRGKVAGMAFDPASRRLLIARGRRLEARGVASDGTLGETSLLGVFPHKIEDVALDAAAGGLAVQLQSEVYLFVKPTPVLALRDALRYTVDEYFENFIPIPGWGWAARYSQKRVDTDTLLPYRSLDDSLTVRAVGIRRGQWPSAARAVARWLLEAPKDARVLGDMLLRWGRRPFTESVWRAFMNLRPSSGALHAGELVPSAHPPRWFADSRSRIRRRMPTLYGILQDPGKAERFLRGLADILRYTHPFERGADGLLPPIARALKSGEVYRLGELNIVPDTESFRRFIIYVDDGEGRFAVELKMPGEEDGRRLIDVQHYTVAEEMWRRFPKDPGVVKPLYYGRFKGKTWLFGQEMEFEDDDPLGIVLFEYHDGKRLSNAKDYLKTLAKKQGRPLDDLIADMAVEVFTTAIRFHELGWQGTAPLKVAEEKKPIRSSDMHAENVRVLEDGNVELVSDFNAFHRRLAPLSMKERSEETIEFFTEFSGVVGPMTKKELKDSGFLEKVFPRVVARLTEGVEDVVEKVRLEEVARLELGLPPPRKPAFMTPISQEAYEMLSRQILGEEKKPAADPLDELHRLLLKVLGSDAPK